MLLAGAVCALMRGRGVCCWLTKRGAELVAPLETPHEDLRECSCLEALDQEGFIDGLTREGHAHGMSSQANGVLCFTH